MTIHMIEPMFDQVFRFEIHRHGLNHVIDVEMLGANEKIPQSFYGPQNFVAFRVIV